MLKAARKFLYTMAWDTRCRNVDVGRLLEPYLKRGAALLDAGCGEHGLAAFVDSSRIVGIDVLPTDVMAEGFTFVHGSILDLPFDDREFQVAASVDVLEHLPSSLRQRAVNELVRAAEKAVIVTFPSGTNAREIDERFRNDLAAAGDDIPDWLSEHLENVYPEVNDISAYLLEAAARTGRRLQISVSYSEAVSVAQRLRRLSLRSKYLYLLGNLTFGVLMPLLPKADGQNAYRAIILAEFIDG